ncbi:recq family helicase [Lasallia pustulata]|uniref:DNA 3'-5' helicase n=1 Tax=Lasallia pustulata TaxID=136370 RepID=A0A1W5CZY1_9LECA|nr:recq family helicase [Lasallia pustulata]
MMNHWNERNTLHSFDGNANPDSTPDARWERVRLQSFSHGNRARYWVVRDGAEESEEEHGSRITRVDKDWEQMLKEHLGKLDQKEEERRGTVDNPTGAENVSIWVRELGWAQHLGEKNVMDLAQASMMPVSAGARSAVRDRARREREQRLAKLGDSFDRVIERCSRRLELVPHETLRWLNSVDPNKPAGDPFRVKERTDTTYRYKQWWKRYLCYSVRVFRLGRVEADTKHGVRFDDRQWALLERIEAHVEEDIDEQVDAEERERKETEMDREVFAYCISSLKQKVAFKVYVNPLLHFAAVLGIDVQRRGWKQPKDYTGQLAGLVWCGRVLMLEHIFEGQPDDPEAISVDMVELFKQEYREWLADGSHTPFSTMIRWMSYGKGFRKKEGGTAKLLWEADGERLRYLGQPIEVDDFREAVNIGVDETEMLLNELMFEWWEEVQRSIEMGRIVDSVLFEGQGRSFATNGRNDWLQPGPRFLTEKGKSSLWVDGQGWKMDAVARYVRTLQAFKLQLLRDTHIWGGQPGRGPEITTLRHCDTQQIVRNVFVHGGELMIITDRDKSRAIRGLGRKVARFLPERIGKMMVAYMAWLIPFEGLLHDQTKIPGPSSSLDSFLWKDARKGLWETPVLSERLASLTGKYIGVDLMISDYRHVAIELGRQVKGMMIRRMEVEIGEGPEADDQDGGDVGVGENREQKRMEYVWDLQATHGSAMARAHYALDVRFPNKLQADMIGHFREISRLWHGYLTRVSPVKGEDEESQSNRKRRAREEAGERLRKRRRIEEEITTEVQTGLQRLLGEQATWKSNEQGEAMHRIMKMNGQETLIVVLPTGGGKSVLFMLPALIASGGTSIVVVPFSALMDDLVDRAKKSGVDCIRWKSQVNEGRDEMQRVARLVVVSADVASSDEFTMYVDSIRARGLLDRIFVDECHTTIMDVGYRRELVKLKGLHRYSCPVIWLTATLPVRLEQWFRSSMLAIRASIIRAPTVKRNIRYSVVRMERPKEVPDEVGRVVGKLRGRMKVDQKGVVYCRSHAMSETLAGQLNCDFYHGGMEEGKRQAVLARWIKGEEGQRWIVATTGLGTGIDIGGIVAIVHMEQPYGLVDFVQQTGRGGRRPGEVVESVIVMGPQEARLNGQKSDVEQLNHQAMGDLIKSPGCRRVMLGLFMDGVGRNCEEVGGQQCDRCRGTVEDVGEMDEEGDDIQEEDEDQTDGENRLKRHVKAKWTGLERLRKWLDAVETCCPVCFVKWHQRGKQKKHVRILQHGMDRCGRIKEEDYIKWRGRVNYAEFGCCYRCGIPQIWCREWAGGECQYRDKVVPVMMMVKREAALKAIVEQEFQVDVEKDYEDWIGRSRIMYGEDMTNGLAVWDLIVREVCKY